VKCPPGAKASTARPPARGWTQLEAALERAVAQLREGEPIHFERISGYASADLAYIVELERWLGGTDFRVTSSAGSATWRVLRFCSYGGWGRSVVRTFGGSGKHLGLSADPSQTSIIDRPKGFRRSHICRLRIADDLTRSMRRPLSIKMVVHSLSDEATYPTTGCA
jgi:hypothetical protein